jgi:hypothetical protein
MVRQRFRRWNNSALQCSPECLERGKAPQVGLPYVAPKSDVRELAVAVDIDKASGIQLLDVMGYRSRGDTYALHQTRTRRRVLRLPDLLQDLEALRFSQRLTDSDELPIVELNFTSTHAGFDDTRSALCYRFDAVPDFTRAGFAERSAHATVSLGPVLKGLNHRERQRPVHTSLESRVTAARKRTWPRPGRTRQPRPPRVLQSAHER